MKPRMQGKGTSQNKNFSAYSLEPQLIYILKSVAMNLCDRTAVILHINVSREILKFSPNFGHTARTGYPVRYFSYVHV